MAEKPYRDKDWLYEQYWIQKKSLPQMAKMAGCSYVTILNWMRKFGIARRTSIESAHLYAQDPEWRKKTIRGARRRSQNPEWRKRNLEAARRRARDPKWRRKMTEVNRRKAQDPGWRKKNLEAARRQARDPEWRRKHTIAMSRRSQDPEYRRRWAKGMRHLALKKRGQGKLTDIEAICHAAFESLGLDFVFEKFIYPYRVDFFFPSHGIIVEALGKYWHEKPKRRKRDAERKAYLEASGYTVLEWWGPAIKTNIYKLIEKELMPLLDRPSRIEKPPRGVSKPYKGNDGWKSARQLYLFGKEQED